MRKKEDRRVEDVTVEEDRRVMERRSPENRKKPRFKRKGKGPDRVQMFRWKIIDVWVHADTVNRTRKASGRMSNWTESQST